MEWLYVEREDAEFVAEMSGDQKPADGNGDGSKEAGEESPKEQGRD